MLTPRSSRTSPCCRPEASTRNDSRRLSAICEKSTFLQYLMEEIAPSGPLEDERIMSRRSSRLLGALATGSPRAVLGKAAVGLEPLSFGGTRRCTISEMRRLEGVFRLRRFAQALVGGARGPRNLGHSLSFPVHSRAAAGEWPRSQRPRSGNRLRASHRAWRRCGLRSSLFLEVLRFLRELD